MGLEKKLSGLGVTFFNKKIFLFGRLPRKQKRLRIYKSDDGFDFEVYQEKNALFGKDGQRLDLRDLKTLRFSSFIGHQFLTFQRKGLQSLQVAYGNSFDSLGVVGNVEKVKSAGMIIPGYKYEGKAALVYGEKELKLAFSRDFKDWEKRETPLLKLDQSMQEDWVLQVANLMVINKGILLVYYLYNQKEETYSLELALLDKNEPGEVLWTNEQPVWEQAEEWEEEQFSPIGVIGFGNRLISYWQVEGKGIYADSHIYPHPQFQTEFKFTPPLPILKKFKNNPLLKPITENFWEAQAVFNPAAVVADEQVHILYRAVGKDGRSVLGYAKSKDGKHIDYRGDEPAYYPRKNFEGAKREAPPTYVPYQSGGGWGGCEDPRLTKIGDQIYLTYVAYDGRHPPRVALSSIDEQDFVNQDWNWKEPQLMSPPGVVDKNACLLPEKVDGKYVVFHRIYPNVLIDFVDHLQFGDGKWLEGEYKITPRKGMWDSRKLGIGPTPIKTEEGWLAIYQAVADNGPYHYKMGAMLLDLDDPTKVVCRSDEPILEPDKNYEFEGFKGGVTYPCGAVVEDKELLVYYGAADTVTCGAKQDLEKFIGQLKTSSSPRLEPLRS